MILGQYSIGDLDDLLKAKSYDIGRLQTLWTQLQGPWLSVDQIAANDWQADWNLFSTKWNNAASTASAIVSDAKATQAPIALMPANDIYLSLLHILKQKDGVISKGDYDDLFQRLSAANLQLSNMGDFSNWNTPQAQNTDADIDIMQLSDHIIGSPSQHANWEEEAKKDLKIAGVIGLGVLIAYGLTVRELNKFGL